MAETGITEGEELVIDQQVEDVLEDTHGLVYLGWIGRTIARAPKIIAAQRWMAYASEGTEPFRPVASKWFVRSGYALSFLYVAADVGVRTRATHIEHHDNKKTSIVFGDTLLFHSFASLLLPAVLIHKIVNLSSKAVTRYNILQAYPRVRGIVPTVLGLASIPFVVGPIDHGVEWAMNNTSRRFYASHLPHEHHE